MRVDQIIAQTRSGVAFQASSECAVPIRLTLYISAEDKADRLEACTALLRPEVAELDAQQAAVVVAAAEPVAQQEAVAAAEAEPVAQEEAVVAAVAVPVARQAVTAARWRDLLEHPGQDAVTAGRMIYGADATKTAPGA